MNKNSDLKNVNAHILLVDDEEYLVKLWKHVIESKGYRVDCYTSGLQALEVFRASPDNYDMVITDHSMPEITGFELAEEIYKIRKSMKVIICSGYLGDMDLYNEVHDKISEILIKPFDSKTLIAAIKRALIKGIDI